MGNFTSGGGNSRRRNSGHGGLHGPSSMPPSSHPTPPAPQRQPPPPPPQPEIAGDRYVFAAATPYPPLQYPNPNPNLPLYYPYPGYYPPHPSPVPVPLPAPSDHHHRGGGGGGGGPPLPPRGDHALHRGWVGGGESGPVPPPMLPHLEHQKAVTIRNDVNIKKETLRVEPDEQNPGCFLVTFTFDATVAGSITVLFFAKEGLDCNLTSMKENLLRPVIVSFKEGLGQKFRQPTGTGINFSMFGETELLKEGEMEVYPLAVKAEASSSDEHEAVGKNEMMGSLNSQITQAVFKKKDSGEYQVRVVKQILWVNGTRYELQEIYGIGNSVDSDFDGNDPGKECVICLSEPRDTTVLPCRHMCMCSKCAKVLGLWSKRCPICRRPVERLLEIKVNNRPEEEQEGGGPPPAELSR